VRRNAFIYSVTQWLARFIFSFLYRIETESEIDVSFKGPAVILPKHQYWTDIPLVSLSFKSPLLFVAKKELFHLPGIRSYLSLLGGIPLDRDRSIKTFSALKYLVSCVKATEAVVIFPEGTYVRGGVGSGKSRLIRMVLGIQSEIKQQIPFIPMGIRYGGRVGWRREVKIRVGSPLFAEEESDALSLTHRIMEEISRLSQLPGTWKSEIRNPKHETNLNDPSAKFEKI
jgi:1-acyl-sn-glycerol-3-phosphate acyltransferase